MRWIALIAVLACRAPAPPALVVRGDVAARWTPQAEEEVHRGLDDASSWCANYRPSAAREVADLRASARVEVRQNCNAWGTYGGAGYICSSWFPVEPSDVIYRRIAHEFGHGCLDILFPPATSDEDHATMRRIGYPW